MQKFYAFALCAGFACILAVLYVLLHIDWSGPAPDPGPDPVPAAEGDASPGEPR